MEESNEFHFHFFPSYIPESTMISVDVNDTTIPPEALVQILPMYRTDGGNNSISDLLRYTMRVTK